MTNLLEGHKYSLSTEEKKSKSVIFVKLTDSAVQSIERFLNLQDDSSLKPSIQFQNNSGIISLPLNGNKLNYGFTISNIEGDGLQSSFQCLQHTDNNSLESLGFIFKKMQIHATEDSYEKTKSKVAAADQEQKNLCTKQLGPNVSRLGNKVNVKRPGLVYIPEKTQSSIVKPEPAKLNSKSKETSPSHLIQMPIRERIIHILAAKPYKKAELLLRLKKEGISDKDKDKISAVLAEVAKIKGNILTLENHIWNEVQDDWEFCSLVELQLIKKKKDQFVKPNNVNGSTGPSKPSVKQKGAVSTPQIPFTKKQKASLNGHKKNNSFQNDSSVTNGNGLKNGSALGIFESLHQFNKKRNDLNPMSKQISSLFSRKNNTVERKNHLASNGTVQASEMSPFQNSITPLKSSFVLSENGREETNGKCQETMSVNITNNGNEIHHPQCKIQSFPTVDSEMSVDVVNNGNEIHQPQYKMQIPSAVDVEMSVDVANNGNEIHQPQYKKQSPSTVDVEMSVDVANNGNEFHQPQYKKQSLSTVDGEMSVHVANNGNEIHQPQYKKQSLSNVDGEMSVCNQIENDEIVSQIQVKQTNNCSETTIDGSGNSSLSVFNNKTLHKQLLNGASSSLSHKRGNKSDDSSSDMLPLSQSAPEFDFTEIQLKYTKVSSLEQRSQYLKDFNNEYEEYLNLKSQMKEISEKFSQLFERLQTCAEDSPEFKKIRVEIGKEYKKTLNNSYSTSRKRFEFLKAKLSHIREVILEYDKQIADEE